MHSLPSSLHSWMTALKHLTEKSTRRLWTCRSGSCTRRFLCMGVNCSLASACTPYWSSVDRGRKSHMLCSGHHKAWSDQSCATSTTKRKFPSQRKSILIPINNSEQCIRELSFYMFTKCSWPENMKMIVNRHLRTEYATFTGLNVTPTTLRTVKSYPTPFYYWFSSILPYIYFSFSFLCK